MRQMRSWNRYKQQKGFTIVELLIVIVVIGILATLVIVTFSGIQQRARDTQRQTDINAIQGHVEAYYASTGNYPTLAMLLDNAAGGFVPKYMKGLDPEALAAPDGTDIAAAAAANGHYQYEAWSDSIGGTACPTATGTSPDLVSTCQAYRLTADLENSGTNYVKQSN
jgi:prepilin-type N-terminal cleavage/methylation domain-containing protein